jgi:two-component system response regulator FixJ
MGEAGVSPGRELFIAESDPKTCDALANAFAEAGFRTTIFEDGQSLLLSARAARPACILLEIDMSGMSGLVVLKELDARTYPAPIIMLSSRGDLASAVEAVRSGAHDVIEKHRDAEAIVAHVRATIEAWEQQHQKVAAHGSLPAFAGSGLLTPREREVLALITASASNKEIAVTLGISPRTVEVHRGKIMQKLNAKNSVDLACIVFNQKRTP